MSLLDGKIEAAAGTVVGAQDQHHIFVADRAAQRFLVVYQRHGMNSVQPLDQTLRVILALMLAWSGLLCRGLRRRLCIP